MSAALKAALILAAIVVLLAQLVPVEHNNPPAEGEVAPAPPVAAILERACYDCHSNQTRWPWYSRVAPLSWLVASHVTAGRRQLNFSEWGRYYPATRRHKLQWMARALHNEQMPPWSYLLMHREAQLSADDRAVLERWIKIELAGPSGQAKGN
jgi:hypothetical protein